VSVPLPGRTKDGLNRIAATITGSPVSSTIHERREGWTGHMQKIGISRICISSQANTKKAKKAEKKEGEKKQKKAKTE
jgi:homospermidine synthase